MSGPIDPRCFTENDPSGWIHFVSTYVFPVLSVIGIVGDVFMILTIHYGRLKDSPYVYLKCIAASDLILMVLHVTTWVRYCEACNFTVGTMYYIELYQWYCHGMLVNLTDAWLGFLTLFLTMERFICVRWPMHTRRFCTRERAKKICFALFLVSCLFELPSRLVAEVDIDDRELPKTGTQIRISNFHCEPGTDQIHVNLSFSSVSDDAGTHVLRTISMNAKIFVVTNGSSVLDDDTHLLAREQLIGQAIHVNESCAFVLATPSSKPIFSDVVDSLLKKHMEIVPCMAVYQRRNWKGFIDFLHSFELVCSCIQAFFTASLTVLNILIVILVRRANREAALGVLSQSEQNTTSRRRVEENRLTMSLLSLSTVKIFTDIVRITSWEAIADWIYKDLFNIPSDIPAKTHTIFSYTLSVAEYSSYFYLLAFFNRKFKEDFLQRVVYGKLKLHGVLGKKSKTTASPSQSAQTQGKNEETQSTRDTKTEARIQTSLGDSVGRAV